MDFLPCDDGDRDSSSLAPSISDDKLINIDELMNQLINELRKNSTMASTTTGKFSAKTYLNYKKYQLNRSYDEDRWQ